MRQGNYKKNMNLLNNNPGFTLIEVLLSLVILSIISLSVFNAVNFNLQSNTRLEERFYASLVADKVFKEDALYKRYSENERNGQVEMVNRTWYWVIKTQIGVDGYLLRKEITVFNDRKQENSIYMLISYVPLKKKEVDV
ncbi:type II secretion system protein GspI [Paraphotobacterium marinum]|uniref:Type II secretion system protein I n=2 Tax=Paraphotobacterium marinum TaxID=1755811 RepID=A0A220VCR8_9GAMM|nr:type II secretion system protein GspI [Paraphotobacterium marinum]